MSEEAVVETKRAKTEYTEIAMEDGRKVQFAGKRKVNKETLIDTGKIEVDEASGLIQFQKGAVSVRMDFRNGSTRTFALPLSLYAQFMGHGAEQKYGDELASPADKPLSEDDMVLAVEDLDTEIQKGNWGRGRAAGGGGVSGASIVVQAIMEATGKDLAAVKAFLDKKIASTEGLTRPALYASFRVKGTRTGDIVARIEAEKLAKTAKVLVDDALLSEV